MNTPRSPRPASITRTSDLAAGASVSICPAFGGTSVTSARDGFSIVISGSAVPPTASTTAIFIDPETVTGLSLFKKPGAETCRSYPPGSSVVCNRPPASLLRMLAAAPESGVISTRARGTAAPFGSVTTTVTGTEPCPHAPAAPSTIARPVTIRPNPTPSILVPLIRSPS